MLEWGQGLLTSEWEGQDNVTHPPHPSHATYSAHIGTTALPTCEVGLREQHVGDSCLEVDVGECPSLAPCCWFTRAFGPALPS